MKLRTLLLSALCLATAQTLTADEAADALWKKVDDAINAIKKPAQRPKSREEAIENLKKNIPAFDDATKAFLEKAPGDSRRWQARLFEAQLSGAREVSGLPAKGDAKATLKEILASTDASAEIKGDASALQLQEAAGDLEDGKGSLDEFKKLTDAHLKTYPEHAANRMIQGKLKSLEAQAEIKTKPLDIKFTSVDGKEVDLAKMRGKVVLIDFWATWCGPCVAELPNVLKAYEKLHPKGFEIIGISLDSDKSKLESFVKEKGMSWAQFFDGQGWKNEISSRYGINSIPAMWLVDKKGMVVSTNVRGRLEAEVEKRLAE